MGTGLCQPVLDKLLEDRLLKWLNLDLDMPLWKDLDWLKNLGFVEYVWRTSCDLHMQCWLKPICSPEQESLSLGPTNIKGPKFTANVVKEVGLLTYRISCKSLGSECWYYWEKSKRYGLDNLPFNTVTANLFRPEDKVCGSYTHLLSQDVFACFFYC